MRKDLQIRKTTPKSGNKNLQIRKKSRKSVDRNSAKNQALWEFLTEHKDIVDIFSDFLSKKKNLGLTDTEFLSFIRDKESYLSIPISIFNNSLSPLEAVVQYLTALGYSLNDISKLLDRSNKTIWTTFHNATRKRVALDVDYSVIVPLSIIADRRLSCLENVTVYLRDTLKLRLADIARLVGKKRNTIWTTYNRGRSKL